MFVHNIQRILNTCDEGTRAWLLEAIDNGEVQTA